MHINNNFLIKTISEAEAEAEPFSIYICCMFSMLSLICFWILNKIHWQFLCTVHIYMCKPDQEKCLLLSIRTESNKTISLVFYSNIWLNWFSRFVSLSVFSFANPKNIINKCKMHSNGMKYKHFIVVIDSTPFCISKRKWMNFCDLQFKPRDNYGMKMKYFFCDDFSGKKL